MSTIYDIQTPAMLVDMTIAKHNLKKFGDLAKANGKEIWPMTKTHKSTRLLALQKEMGATGFLGGTLDECEAACKAGYQNIMYAYPVATKASMDRVLQLVKSACDFILRIDCRENAEYISKAAVAAGVVVDYTIIIDSGLHRFGVEPGEAFHFYQSISDLQGIRFRGISTHPGHVYLAGGPEDVPVYVKDEREAIACAVDALHAGGVQDFLVTSGSTPTFEENVADENIQIYHPGNYIFMDCIQMSNGTAKQEECALTILAAVISKPREGLLICDAGAKCLGLDQGAHGNASVKGYGRVLGHPELTMYSLSEEVGKFHVEGKTDLQVGDLIRIIPNHSCIPASQSDYLFGIEGDEITEIIPVDIRVNKTKKGL